MLNNRLHFPQKSTIFVYPSNISRHTQLTWLLVLSHTYHSFLGCSNSFFAMRRGKDVVWCVSIIYVFSSKTQPPWDPRHWVFTRQAGQQLLGCLAAHQQPRASGCLGLREEVISASHFFGKKLTLSGTCWLLMLFKLKAKVYWEIRMQCFNFGAKRLKPVSKAKYGLTYPCPSGQRQGFDWQVFARSTAAKMKCFKSTHGCKTLGRIMMVRDAVRFPIWMKQTGPLFGEYLRWEKCLQNMVEICSNPIFQKMAGDVCAYLVVTAAFGSPKEVPDVLGKWLRSSGDPARIPAQSACAAPQPQHQDVGGQTAANHGYSVIVCFFVVMIIFQQWLLVSLFAIDEWWGLAHIDVCRVYI